MFVMPMCAFKNVKMKCSEDDLDFSLFASPLISTNALGDLFWQNPPLFYILAWCNKMWYNISNFPCETQFQQQQKGFFVVHTIAEFFSCLTSVQSIISICYQGSLLRAKKITMILPFPPTSVCVPRNGNHTFWHICEIFYAVTPPDKGLWTKPFSCCFTASPMISTPAGWVHLLCAPDPSQHDPKVGM